MEVMKKRIAIHKGTIMECIHISYWTEDILDEKWGWDCWQEMFWFHDHSVPARALYPPGAENFICTASDVSDGALHVDHRVLPFWPDGRDEDVGGPMDLDSDSDSTEGPIVSQPLPM